MHRSKLSRSLSCLLMLAFPWSMWAADSSGAMLYANGTAWLNGANVPKTSAVFSGDLIQTKADSVASIKANGSNFTVQSDSLVQYQGQSLKLEHGAVTVATSKAVVTEIGDVSVKPASGQWTEFRIRDINGTVQIAANKGDLLVTDAQGNTSTVTQGQETTREDSPAGKRRRRRSGGAVPGAQGTILNSRVALYLGLGAVGGVTTWVLMQGDEPPSPSTMSSSVR